MSGSHLLVISDLHLGEDIGTASERLGLPRIALTELELISFLDHHAANPVGERPWHLVINGDMIDFLAMIVMPGEAGVIVGLDEDDHFYGLGTTRDAALAKLDRVIARHEAVFRSLARFVAAGHRVTIVVGNHDVELYWPEVREALRAHLARLAGDDGGFESDRISFREWFVFESGVWIEHGHLYDPYCSVELVLDPFTADGRDIDPSLSAFTMRYLNNHFSPHPGHHEPWGMGGYLLWFVRQGAARMHAILAAFTRMTERLLAFARRAALPSEARHRRRLRHARKVFRLAREVGLPPRDLLRVDRLRRRPVVLNRIRVLRALMLDRLALLVAAGLIFASALAVLPWAPFGVLTALLVAAVAAAHRRLAQTSEATVSTGRLASVARKIRAVVPARVVVFGHTHEPIATEDENGLTVNTGSWVPDEVRGLRGAFTHLRVLVGQDGSLDATLRRWRDGRSEPAPDLGTARGPVRQLLDAATRRRPVAP